MIFGLHVSAIWQLFKGFHQVHLQVLSAVHLQVNVSDANSTTHSMIAFHTSCKVRNLDLTFAISWEWSMVLLHQWGNIPV